MRGNCYHFRFPPFPLAECKPECNNDVGVAAPLAVRACLTARVWMCVCVRACVHACVGALVCVYVYACAS